MNANQPPDKPEQSSDSSPASPWTALGDPPVLIHDDLLYASLHEIARSFVAELRKIAMAQSEHADENDPAVRGTQDVGPELPK